MKKNNKKIKCSLKLSGNGQRYIPKLSTFRGEGRFLIWYALVFQKDVVI